MRRDVPASARPVVGLLPEQRAREGVWVLELPFAKPLSLNDRMPWPQRARLTRPWREAAQRLAREAGIPACRRITVQLLYTPKDSRARDPLNLTASLKPVEDGLVDAGVIPDDSGAFHTSVMPVITAKGLPRAAGNRLWVEVSAH